MITKLITLCSLLLVLSPIYSQAQLAAPVVPVDTSGSCVKSTEICGDGIDQDCDGFDSLCSGEDKDRDGYPKSSDCDEENRHIFPGVYVPCQASCGRGVSRCESNSALSACSCTPLCEASGSGKCYYISALAGKDSNPGTFNKPWKSYLPVVSYYAAEDAPSSKVNLAPGDVVYFMSGVYGQTYRYNDKSVAMFLRGVKGTTGGPIKIKAYPGEKVTISPQGTAGLEIQESENLILEGLHIKNATGYGLGLFESTNIEASNLWVQDTDGSDNDNIAGIYVNDVSMLNIHNSLVHDNYDRTNQDTGGKKTQNSRDIVLFGGGQVRIHHNVIYQTPSISADKTGGCITSKHSSTVPGAVFEIDNNIFWNCAMVSIGSSSPHSRIHNNLILNSDPIRIDDFGGPAHHVDNIIENNTIIGGPGLVWNPTTDWGTIGTLTYRKNIVVDNNEPYNVDRGILVIGTYQSDDLYTQVVEHSNLKIDNNCYYNSATTPQWNLFNRNGGSYGIKGGAFSFADWQQQGFDLNSRVVDPSLDSSYIPKTAACQSMGYGAL